MPAITEGSVVKSAEGALYHVRYLNKAIATVDVCPLDADLTWRPDETIELPIAELRRVRDPRNAKPPIEDVPASRPRCQHCNRMLAIRTNNTVVYQPVHRITRRVFYGWSGYGRDARERSVSIPLFCTLRCALHFAVAAHRAGYRIKTKGH